MPRSVFIDFVDMTISANHIIPGSLQLVTFAGCLHKNLKSRAKELTRLDMGQVLSIPNRPYGVPVATSANPLPACPQYVTGESTMWNKYSPPNLLVNLGENLNQGAVAWSTSEDCLSLAVWTPSYANRTSKLPVALFVTGGGGITGGIEIPSQLPSPWVSRSQEHIVVTINYRANIFGSTSSRPLCYCIH